MTPGMTREKKKKFLDRMQPVLMLVLETAFQTYLELPTERQEEWDHLAGIVASLEAMVRSKGKQLNLRDIADALEEAHEQLEPKPVNGEGEHIKA